MLYVPMCCMAINKEAIRGRVWQLLKKQGVKLVISVCLACVGPLSEIIKFNCHIFVSYDLIIIKLTKLTFHCLDRSKINWNHGAFTQQAGWREIGGKGYLGRPGFVETVKEIALPLFRMWRLPTKASKILGTNDSCVTQAADSCPRVLYSQYVSLRIN